METTAASHGFEPRFVGSGPTFLPLEDKAIVTLGDAKEVYHICIYNTSGTGGHCSLDLSIDNRVLFVAELLSRGDLERS